MKRIVWIFINNSFFFYYQLKFFLFFYIFKSKDNIVFVDIDNTIANTWPTINNKLYKNEIERNLNIPVFQGMKRYLNQNFKKDDHIIIYLSARNYRLLGVTNRWLEKNGFLSNDSSLILVFKPDLKIYFLKKAIEYKYNVVFIDDLSYNHENYDTKFYNQIILQVKSMKLTYIDYNKILEINSVA